MYDISYVAVHVSVLTQVRFKNENNICACIFTHLFFHRYEPMRASTASTASKRQTHRRRRAVSQTERRIRLYRRPGSRQRGQFGVNSGLSQIKALEAAEISSQSALDSNKLGYQVGIRINIDVLNAQQQLFSTRQSLSKARYDAILNGLRLKSAAGSLKESDLVEVNALLQH